MRYIFFFFCFFTTGPLLAQLLYPEVMEPRSFLAGPVVAPEVRLPSFPPFLVGKRLDNITIENPGTRYALQNLKNESFDPEVDDAIHTLIKYAGNERLKYLVDYLKNYTRRNMATQEQALRKAQERITQDSLEFYKENEHLLTGDFDEYLNTDLQTLVNHIRKDSNYIWLHNASRDSAFLEIKNMSDNSVCFWIDNGRTRFHRFWACNKFGDTIGTWIQVMPHGKQLKIYVDEDVYQAPSIEKKIQTRRGYITNEPTKEYFNLRQLNVGELKRHYWTYYSEVEIAMSQGKLANWASGGENSLSLLSNLRYFWNYNRNKTSWENWVHYRFGFMKNGSEEIRKNEDRFELNSKVGQKAFKHWYYTAQFNALTQLFNSFEYPKDKDRKLVANFMSPGYFTLSLGMDFKPNNNFSLILSPIAGKWNFVRDTAKIEANRYGISEKGKRYRREAGAQLNLMSKLNNLLKIMDMSNELKIFMSYERKDKYINEGKENEERKHIPLTANWKLTLNFKINYFMSASIYTETIYDENYSRKLQFKENLNLGVKFRF